MMRPFTVCFCAFIYSFIYLFRTKSCSAFNYRRTSVIMHSATKTERLEVKIQHQILYDVLVTVNEPRHEKSNNLHMRKQRRKSASRLLITVLLCFRYTVYIKLLVENEN